SSSPDCFFVRLWPFQPPLDDDKSEGMSPYEIYYVLATDDQIQRLNELSAAMAEFAAPPNNSSLPLGHLRAIPRSGIFVAVRLCRRETSADLLGAARGIKRRLRVALELRHHLARDQFVAAHCC